MSAIVSHHCCMAASGSGAFDSVKPSAHGVSFLESKPPDLPQRSCPG